MTVKLVLQVYAANDVGTLQFLKLTWLFYISSLCIFFS